MAANSIAWSSGFFGLLYGAACVAEGIAPELAWLSSLIVFSGAVQFAALGLLDQELALWAIAISTFLICNRLILMGMAVAPHLQPQPVIARAGALHLLTDGAWVVTLGTRPSNHSYYSYISAGLWVLGLWSIGTAIGAYAANLFDPTLTAALGFTAVIFLMLLLLLVVRRTEMPHAPWIISAITALLASLFMPVALAFLLGVAAGGLLALQLSAPSGP